MTRPSTAELAAWDRQYLWHPFTQMRDWLKREPIIIASGEGAVLRDVRGREFLDANSSSTAVPTNPLAPVTMTREGISLRSFEFFIPRCAGILPELAGGGVISRLSTPSTCFKINCWGRNSLAKRRAISQHHLPVPARPIG